MEASGKEDKFLKYVIEYRRYIYFAIGFVCTFWSLGLFNTPILIFVWPFTFLYLLHHEPRKYISIPLIILFTLFSNFYKWKHFSYTFKLTMKRGYYWWAIQFIPYVLEGITYGVVEKWRSVILFPLYVASIEFLFSIKKIANNTMYAYALSDNLILIQMTSLFGTHSLSFMIALFASILEYAIQYYRQNSKKIHKSVWIYLGVMFFFYFYSSIYIQFPPKKENHIKVFSTVGPEPLAYEATGMVDMNFLTADTIGLYVDQDAKEAKQNGCDLLSYAEESFTHVSLYGDSIKAAIAKAASNNDIMISYSIDIEEFEVDEKGVPVFDENGAPVCTGYKNGNLFFDEKGNMLDEYIKHNLVTTSEQGYTYGKDKLKAFKTKYGTWATVICYDVNFSPFINYLIYKHEPKVLIVPSYDTHPVARLQSEVITRFRAIENGVNILKNTFGGITMAFDYTGRVLVSHFTDNKDKYKVVTDLFYTGKVTLWSCIGIFFNYFYIVAIFLVIFIKFKFNCKNIIHIKEDESLEENQYGTQVTQRSEDNNKVVQNVEMPEINN